MKTRIILFLTFCLFSIGGYAQTTPLIYDLGAKSSPFIYTHTQDLTTGSSSYGYRPYNDVFYKITLNKSMDIRISHEGSSLDFTCISLTDLSMLHQIKYACGNSQTDGHPVLEYKKMPPGSYYIISEGALANGAITTTIQGEYVSSIDLGSINESFAYTHTQNTQECENNWEYRPTNDMYYKIRLMREGDIIVSHCGSPLTSTCVTLVNVNNSAQSWNASASSGKCSSATNAYLEVKKVPAGTYYVISEGATTNGNITTSIEVAMNTPMLANSVRTRTYQYCTGAEYMETIWYFNGLGYPVQKVQKGSTPGKKDLATIQEYDRYGREAATWLPGISTGNGVYTDPLLVKASASSLAMNNDQTPYSLPVYEASPLNRVVEQYGPGQDWQSKKKTVRTGWLTNVLGNDTLNCIRYTTTDHATVDTVTTINRVGNYNSGELYVTHMADEDGNTSFEFKDKLSQTVLTRQIIRSGTTKLLHDTYYVYDDFGNLKAVLPPMAADAMKTSTSWVSNTDATLKNYAYLYRYDKRNRCVVKKLPGADCIRSIYDKADRLIFSQNGEQRVKKVWFFSIPDALGRVVLTGTCELVGSKAITNADFEKSLVIAEYNSTGTYNRYIVKKDTSPVAIGTPVHLITNYYDNYEFMTLVGFAALTYSLPTGADAAFNTRDVTNPHIAKTQLTGTIVGDAGGGAAKEYSVLYYDSRGRMIQSRSTNFLGGKETECFVYNFTGQTIKKLGIHQRLSTSTETKELYSYTYDHAGRMLTTTHQLNGGTVVTIATNAYDELGRVKTKQQHGTTISSSYSYNVRNWLTGITGTKFTENLYYNTVPASSTGITPCFNGNISSMTWKSGLETVTRGYKFTYDNLSRLTQAVYGEGSNIATNPNRFNEKITEYDKHGNIRGIQRYGKITASTYALVDDLNFGYVGNQMKYVNDAITTGTGFQSFHFLNGSNVTTNEYLYDKNGNLAKDLNKNITSIQYNSLNLPSKVTLSGNRSITSAYSAAGVKQQVTYQEGSTQSTTDYCGNVIYEKGVLAKILMEEGYITLSGTTPTYHYYLKDHLGNNRVVLKQDGTTVEQVNHFYPFGGLFDQTAETLQAYKYNGKELDRTYGLDLYDYSARYMDGALGRFTTMDPLSEKYYSVSPYAYCANNPMRFVDPDGKDVVILRNSAGAGGTGHAAVLIGSDRKGWTYISKDGYAGDIPFNSESRFSHKTFATLDEFKNSPHNFVLESGTHSTRIGTDAIRGFNFKLDADGNRIQRYDQAALIETTQADGSSTDDRAKVAGLNSAKSKYSLTTADCSDVVTSVVNATQNSSGEQVQNGESKLRGAYGEKPNVKYDKIIKRNPEIIVIDDKLRPQQK